MKKKIILAYIVLFYQSIIAQHVQSLPMLQKKESINISEFKNTSSWVETSTTMTKEIISLETLVTDSLVTQTRSILINTSITEKTITYERHWYKPFPSEFKISVNDQDYMTLDNGKPKLHDKAFTLDSNNIKVAYEWTLNKFGKLWHTEKKELHFEIPPDKKEFNINFSWDSDVRIIIDNAKMILCSNLDQTKQSS